MSLSERLQGRRVVVAGDVMLDRYWVGTADRLSPEAPVPVIDVHEKRAVLGGAANVAANAAALGADVVLVGAIGADEPGRILTGLVQELGITNQLVEAPRPTTVKTRIVAQGQQVVRVDEELRDDLSAAYHRAYEAALLRAVSNAEVLVLQDYGKGALSDSTIHQAIRACKSWSIPVVVDPKSRDFRSYREATVLKPNLREFTAAYDEHIRPELRKEGEEPGGELSSQTFQAWRIWKVKNLLVTLGAQGMWLESGNQSVSIPGRPVPVADISGAGDTVSAWLACLLASGMDLHTAARFANVAGSVQVAKQGTAVVYLDEVIAAMDQTY